jgi:hypothetical protein
VIISDNECGDVFDAMDAAGLVSSWIDFSSNRVKGATYGGYLYDAPSPLAVTQTTSSEILVRNNVLIGSQYGVYLDATFAGGSECQVLSNELRNVSDVGIYLGSNTSHCMVMANGGTNLQNLGLDNVIVEQSSTAQAVGGPPFAGRAAAHR